MVKLRNYYCNPIALTRKKLVLEIIFIILLLIVLLLTPLNFKGLVCTEKYIIIQMY